MLHIFEVTHKVKGLKEPKEIVALGDTHLTYIDERDDEWCQQHSHGRSYMFPNGDRCFKEIREYIKKTQPDAVVTVGDFIDYPTRKNIEFIDDFFNNDCKAYMYPFGNHDWNFPRTYNSIYNWRGDTPKFNCVLKDENPYVQVLDLGDVLIVGVDDCTDTIFPETLEQFKKVVALGKPMILTMHLPFYTPGMKRKLIEEGKCNHALCVGTPADDVDKIAGCVHCLANPVTDEFIRIMRDPEVPIVAVLTGHMHLEYAPVDYMLVDEYMEGRTQYNLRISTPQLIPEGCLMLMHLVPDEE